MAKEINLTYETLFDITRREKMQEDLQKLDEKFYENLIAYITDKAEIMEKNPQSNLFAQDERQITMKQLDNIRRLVSELYSRRERKIINLAIIKSRTSSKLIDTSALLPQEKSLFSFVHKLLNHSKRNVLHNLLQGKLPVPLDIATCFQMQDEEPEKSEPKEKPEQKKEEEESIIKRIKFLSPVPKFVGKELEVYGPYDKEDVAELPLEIADVLINKGRAEEIKQ